MRRKLVDAPHATGGRSEYHIYKCHSITHEPPELDRQRADFILARPQAGEVRQPRERVRQDRQLVPVHMEGAEGDEVVDVVGERGQLVLVDDEVLERREHTSVYILLTSVVATCCPRGVGAPCGVTAFIMGYFRHLGQGCPAAHGVECKSSYSFCAVT
jgi:hypothetical protein